MLLMHILLLFSETSVEAIQKEIQTGFIPDGEGIR